VRYSCLLFSVCSAYAEIGLSVLIYCVCSLCLVAIDLLDWPTYELLQVLHLSVYILLEFLLVLAILISELLYSVCGKEGYIQISVFEEISYFSY
jgi:hypothetical protein